MSITGPITLPDPAPWMTQALCAQCDPDLWHPNKGDSVSAPRKICQSCPVKTDCLNHAVEHGERDGIWGGLTGFQRRRLGSGEITQQDCPQCGRSFIPTGPGQVCCSRSCGGKRRYAEERSA